MNESTNTETDELESLVGQVADEYTDRVNRGERVEIEEYAERYPLIAAVLRQMLPSLGLVGKLNSLTMAAQHGIGSTITPPEYLGEYHILREIGRGGMGVVYEAQQKSLGRRVALKVLPFHRLMDPLYLKRFQREAQAAARLHHTNIVPVFGVGELEGIHFYAMQFIVGQGLDRVIKERTDQKVSAALSDQSFSQFCRSVARIGVQIAEALAYAHSQGILHRDIKPSNLLLDSAGTVWVTDFGLAKADSTEDLTHTGDLVGTLRYAAPERLAGQSDARSDVFSLGLTLYELLTLRPAYDEKSQGRLVQQVTAAEPPPPRRLDRRIPRDLNTIIQKATAREPERRYATATEMSRDLQRFMEDRPIEARRASHLEQIWRWCRRNPALAGLTAAFFAALILGLGAVLWQWRLTDRQRQEAEANFQKARNAVDECFTTVTTNPALQEPGMEAARHVLFQAALKYYQEFLNQRADDAGTQADLARAYYRLGYITERIGSKTEALAAYEQACTLFEKLASSEPTNPKLRMELAQCYQCLGDLHRLMGRSDQAEGELLKALTVREELARSHPTESDYQDDLAGTHQALGTLYRTTGRPAQAEDSILQAQKVREKIVRDFPARGDYRHALARDLSELSRLYAASSRPGEAEAALRKALDTLEELTRNHPGVSEYQDSLATSFNALGSFLLNSGGGFTKVEAAYRKGLTIREQLVRDHPKVQEYQSELARLHNNLALYHYIRQRDDQAADHYGKALALREKLAREHPQVVAYKKAVATTHHDLGLLFRRAGRWADAERSFREALAIQENLWERNREISDFAIELATTLRNLGLHERGQGNTQASVDCYTRAIQELQDVLKSEPQQTDARNLLVGAYAGRARSLTNLGRHADARADWDRSLEYCRKDAIPGTRLGRAATLAHLGNYQEAVALAERITAENEREKLYLSESLRARVFAAAAVAAAADAQLEFSEKLRLSDKFAARALELLERAFAAHEFAARPEIVSLQIDRDFEILRSRPGFLKLLEKIDLVHKKTPDGTP